MVRYTYLSVVVLHQLLCSLYNSSLSWHSCLINALSIALSFGPRSTLGDFGGGVKNPDMLAEYVREKLSRSIVRPYLDSQGVLPVLTLNGNAERMVQEGIRQTDNGATFLSLNPAAAQRLVQNINSAVENAVNTDGQPVILASPIVRPHLAQLIDPFSAEVLEAALNAYVADNGLKFKEVAPPLRTALMGFMGGSHLNEIMAFLGREETLARLERAAG